MRHRDAKKEKGVRWPTEYPSQSPADTNDKAEERPLKY